MQSSKVGGVGKDAEAHTAKRLNGRMQPASGAMAGAKGDIVTDTCLVECKSTTGASIAVKHDWLSKIAHEAQGKNKIPALSLVFVDAMGRPVRSGAWVLVPERDFVERFSGDVDV